MFRVSSADIVGLFKEIGVMWNDPHSMLSHSSGLKYFFSLAMSLNLDPWHGQYTDVDKEIPLSPSDTCFINRMVSKIVSRVSSGHPRTALRVIFTPCSRVFFMD